MNIQTTKEQDIDRVPQNFKQQILGALNKIEAWINGQTSYSPPYKSYVGFISQSGTANPTFVIVKNELSGTINWDRFQPGYYTGTLIGAFTANKTIVFISACDLQGDGVFAASCGRTDNDTLFLTSSNSVGQADNSLFETPIEIRVYN